LFLSSLIFFAWGGVSYSLILITSIILNFFVGKAIGTSQNYKKTYLTIGLFINLLSLLFFKYANFLIDNINQISSGFNIPPLENPHIVLPIGISFYTFQSVSYLIDIYRREVDVQKNIVKLGLYISLFPQLIAGPIVRYKDIASQLSKRAFSHEKFASGTIRFSLGLAKKVLIANNMAVIADHYFGMDPSGLASSYAWIGIIAYTFQIYYDFSGYSDMAIGLGRMFGFDIVENFNFPYIASSVQDFWRRWHISLSSWFRDYLYIPLGGNRRSAKRTYANLFVVFFVTGFWHGASWNFLAWGLIHGFFLIIERLGMGKLLTKIPKIAGQLYTFFVVLNAWVLFKADTLTHAIDYYKAMFGHTNAEFNKIEFFFCVSYEGMFFFAIGLLGAIGFFPFLKNFSEKKLYAITSHSGFKNIVEPFGKASFAVIVIFLATAYLLSDTYNPFIYFRF